MHALVMTKRFGVIGLGMTSRVRMMCMRLREQRARKHTDSRHQDARKLRWEVCT